MEPASGSLGRDVERVVREHGLAGLAIGAVHDGDVLVSRGFGTRDARTGDPVTPDTLFRRRHGPGP